MDSTGKTGPKFVYWIGFLGWIIFFGTLLFGVPLILFDIFWGAQNPYTGVITYMIVPGLLSSAGGMIFFSYYIRYRRRSHGEIVELPKFTLDLGNSRQRKQLEILGIAIILFGCLSALGTYRSYHFTESTQFCGMTCHKVMQPEYVTYHNSPHAEVGCVECHIGAGADWYVKSKMSGLYQVYSYNLNVYKLPIETPIHNLRPARETCEECHWPDKFGGNREKILKHTLRDEENTPFAVRLLLKVGGKQGEEASGIHWHVSSGYRIEYIANSRDRMEIPWVRMTDPKGKTTIFTTEECDPNITASTHEMRLMDCIDCHNRPSHIFNDPMKMVDKSIANGQIDRSLPGIKTTLMDLLEKPYASTPEALAAFDKKLNETYLVGSEIKSATLEKSVAKTRETLNTIYTNNFFPEMKVDWTTHPDFIGHFRWEGCYRCHDGNHKSQFGDVISHDCNTCHLIIGQAEGEEAVNNMPYGITEFNHPMDMGSLEPGANCTDCHAAPEPTDYSSLQPESVQAKN